MEVQRYRNVLQYLLSQVRRERNGSSSLKTTYEILETELGLRGANVLRPPLRANAKSLRGHVIRDDSIDFGGDNLLPLPPLPRTRFIVPFLHVKLWRRPNDGGEAAGKEQHEEWLCKLHIFLFKTDGSGNVSGEFGFRIESPEGPRGEGVANERIHGFYHAQLMSKFLKKESLLKVPSWIPDRQPSFALMATNTTEALLNLLVALYGKYGVSDFWSVQSASRLLKCRVTDQFKCALLQ